MRTKNINWPAVIVLAVALALPLSLVLHGQGVRYPRIRAAMSNLQNAHVLLGRAGHHYGGHRVQAMRAVNEAIAQCQAAIRWANQH